MGEQKQFRSEEARKNYEKQEKRREQAAKRKAFQAKKDRLTESAKACLTKDPKKTALAILAAVLAIVLVSLGCKAFFDPLKDRQDNWLILDVSASSKSHDYRHLADFELPAGFTRDDYSLYTDGVQQDFFCIADDENNPVQDVYVTGAKGVNAAEYPATILSYGLHKEAGEPRTLTIGGHECSAIYLVSDESEWSGEGMAIAHMSFYFDTGKNACISATFRSGTMLYEQLPDEAAMLAEAERILAGLTILD